MASRILSRSEDQAFLCVAIHGGQHRRHSRGTEGRMPLLTHQHLEVEGHAKPVASSSQTPFIFNAKNLHKFLNMFSIQGIFMDSRSTYTFPCHYRCLAGGIQRGAVQSSSDVCASQLSARTMAAPHLLRSAVRRSSFTAPMARVLLRTGSVRQLPTDVWILL